MSASRHSRRRRSRAGFTLVELLVVIAIIGVLVSLLLAAVQSAREAARRTQCQQHLRQMGLAVLNHVSAVETFPTGGAASGARIEDYRLNGLPMGSGQQGLGWAFQILPYMEELAVYRLAKQTELQGTKIPVYNCPSRRDGESQLGSRVVHLIDYAAAQPCTGECAQSSPGCPDPVPRYQPSAAEPITPSAYELNWPSVWGGRNMNFRFQANYQVYDGIIVRSPWLRNDPLITHDNSVGGNFLAGVARPTTPARILDGSSKTLVLAEKYVRSNQYQGGGPSDDNGWSEGWDTDVIRSTCFPPVRDSDGFQYQQLGDEDIFGPDKDVVYFGSAHPGGFQSVFADGSVRSLNYQIQATVLNALATRAGREVVDAF